MVLVAFLFVLYVYKQGNLIFIISIRVDIMPIKIKLQERLFSLKKYQNSRDKTVEKAYDVLLDKLIKTEYEPDSRKKKLRYKTLEIYLDIIEYCLCQ